MEVRTLEHITNDVLADTFSAAFADYPTQFSHSQIFSILKRRGYRGDFSVGMFDNGRLVSFVLNGVRSHNGLLTAYDTGTGTIKEYRGKGLTKRLLNEAVATVKSKGVEQYLLEVLCENAPAVALYEKNGFRTDRIFLCHSQSMSKIQLPDSKTNHIEIEALDVSSVTDTYGQFCDFTPSWQNSVKSILAAHDELIGFRAKVGANTVGLVVGDPHHGDIAVLAVAPGMRRIGIGTELLKSFVAHNRSDIVKILNIDERCQSLPEFLKRCNIPESVRQYEMSKLL